MSSQPSDPLHGIEFTPEELRIEISSLRALIGTEQDQSVVGNAVTFLALAHSILPVVDTDTDRLLLEDEIATNATDTVKIVKERFGSTFEGIGRLVVQQERPLKRRVEAEKQLRERAHRSESIQSIRDQITTIENRHAITSKDLRVPIIPVGKERKNGTWLKQRIVELQEPGTDTPVFQDEEARWLSGLSLTGNTHEKLILLQRSMETIAGLQVKLFELGQTKIEAGLFSAISKLAELYEADAHRLSNRAELRILVSFIEAYLKREDELAEHFLAQVDEGPFASADEIPLVPFEASSIEGRVLKDHVPLRELDDSEINEDAMLEDTKRSIAISGLNAIVVPERVTDFIALRERIIDFYGASAVRTMRSLRPKWHPLPWYGLEVKQGEGNKPLVVLECAVYGNASYYINNGDWEGTVRLSRLDARKVGAKAYIHPDNIAHDHVGLLFNAVRKGYKG